MGIRTPYLSNLLPGEVRQLVSDLHLQREGAKIYYAVDPYDLFDFCFPTASDNPVSIDVDAIAECQAALYDVFYTRPEKVVLLPEYRAELRGVLAWLNNGLGRSYSVVDSLEKIIQVGGLDALESHQGERWEEIIQSNFHVILAVVMGLYSFGADRLKTIRRRHLSTDYIEPQEQSDTDIIKDLFDSYTPSPLVEIILRELNSGHSSNQRMRQNDYTDARAIDRVIYLNNVLEQAFTAGNLQYQYVILYLSSASKNRRIFSLPQVQDALPILRSRKYPLWRTREQAYFYAVHKSKASDPLESLRETIDNLRTTYVALLEVNKLNDSLNSDPHNCSECILQTESNPDCTSIVFCTEVKKIYAGLRSRRGEIDNLGLLSRIETYNRLLSAKPPESHEKYLRVFAEIMQSGAKDLAREKMHLKLRWLQVQSEFAYLIKEGFGKAIERRALWSGKDSVVDIDQHLPIKPRLRLETHKEILGLIVDYFNNPSLYESLQTAYERFVNLEQETRGLGPDLLLIKCFLYLAFGKEEGGEKAYDNILTVMGERRLLESSPFLERECLYLLCWIARRAGRFVEADEWARTGINKWVGDARFYHGRCLNTYSWLNRDETSSVCPHTIRDAISDAEKAIELYEEDYSNNGEMVVANYCNLALLYTCEAQKNPGLIEDKIGRLNKARHYLNKVKRAIPKGAWSPNHPDYYYTEALIEYQECKASVGNKLDAQVLIAKLKYAKSDIETAMQLYEEVPHYLALQTLIENELNVIPKQDERARDGLLENLNAPMKIFYSYSHKDEKLRAQLNEHMAMLRRQGLIEEWHDRLIDAGEDWSGKIDEHLREADIILILVTAAFLASDYCYDVEMKEAIKRHEQGNAHVIPVILRPCLWKDAPFSKLQALPENAKPVSTWPDRQEALFDIAQGVKKVVEGLREQIQARTIRSHSATGDEAVP